MKSIVIFLLGMLLFTACSDKTSCAYKVRTAKQEIKAKKNVKVTPYYVRAAKSYKK